MVMMSFLVNLTSVIRSFQFFVFTFNCSMASNENTLPEVAIATMLLFSLKVLKSTGQWYFPSAFL